MGRLISVSPLLHPQLAFEPKKSFIYNKTRLVADPNEPKEPNEKQSHRLASFCHSPIQIGVPSPCPSIFVHDRDKALRPVAFPPRAVSPPSPPGPPPTHPHMRVLYT